MGWIRDSRIAKSQVDVAKLAKKNTVHTQEMLQNWILIRCSLYMRSISKVLEAKASGKDHTSY